MPPLLLNDDNFSWRERLAILKVAPTHNVSIEDIQDMATAFLT
jgi:hypothetical protein